MDRLTKLVRHCDEHQDLEDLVLALSLPWEILCMHATIMEGLPPASTPYEMLLRIQHAGVLHIFVEKNKVCAMSKANGELETELKAEKANGELETDLEAEKANEELETELEAESNNASEAESNNEPEAESNNESEAESEVELNVQLVETLLLELVQTLLCSIWCFHICILYAAFDLVLLLENKGAHSSRCGECGRPHASKRCALCRAVVYCSEVCQRRNWTEHRIHCRNNA